MNITKCITVVAVIVLFFLVFIVVGVYVDQYSIERESLRLSRQYEEATARSQGVKALQRMGVGLRNLKPGQITSSQIEADYKEAKRLIPSLGLENTWIEFVYDAGGLEVAVRKLTRLIEEEMERMGNPRADMHGSPHTRRK